MRIQRVAGLEAAAGVTGTAIVIDVLRAFTTAPYAFGAGALAVELVATPADAFARRAADPRRVLVGEVHGRPIAGFDHGNSPARMEALDLRGRVLALRSTSGVQGVLRALATARDVLAASLVTASATAARARRLGSDVTLMALGAPGEAGPEDEACGDLLEALLTGVEIDREALADRVRASPAGLRALDPDVDWISSDDLDRALAFDRFPYALAAVQRNGAVWLEPGNADGSRAVCVRLWKGR